MKSNTLIKFGEIVRKKRQEQGLSQEDFAELVGVHRTYVGMIERAEKNITLLNIEKIAQAFDISMSELLENL